MALKVTSATCTARALVIHQAFLEEQDAHSYAEIVRGEGGVEYRNSVQVRCDWRGTSTHLLRRLCDGRCLQHLLQLIRRLLRLVAAELGPLQEVRPDHTCSASGSKSSVRYLRQSWASTGGGQVTAL